MKKVAFIRSVSLLLRDQGGDRNRRAQLLRTIRSLQLFSEKRETLGSFCISIPRLVLCVLQQSAFLPNLPTLGIEQT